MPAPEPRADRRLVVCFTHDLHSHLAPVRAADADGSVRERGGYARIAHVVQEQRARWGDRLLLVDAGDFSMGTLFHAINPTHAPELRAMGAMGFDFATFGNHEFDLRSDNLARMLNAARASGERLPALVASNHAISRDNERGRALAAAFESYPVLDYVVIERNGLRVGLFGLMGRDAGEDTAQPRDVAFPDAIDSARRVVDVLQRHENVDVVVALSHSGTWADPSRSEDELLARAVPQIDVIVSGHTHTALAQPIVVDETLIVSAGCYGANLGVCQLDFRAGGRARLVDYHLVPITHDVPAEPHLVRTILAAKEVVDERFLSAVLSNLTFDRVIARSDFNCESLPSIYTRPLHESGLGNLITDAYRAIVRTAEGGSPEAFVHCAFEPIGMIRDSLVAGPITIEDAFRVLSLGLGPDDQLGVPLSAFYWTGNEIKQALEINGVAESVKSDLYLQASGLRYTCDPSRPPLQRVTGLWICEPSGEEDSAYRLVEPQRLYRVVVNYWFVQALGSISEKTFGQIHLVPKDATGRPIADLTDTIVMVDLRETGRPLRELKEWMALALYLHGLPDLDGDGLPQVPARYRSPEGRATTQP